MNTGEPRACVSTLEDTAEPDARAPLRRVWGRAGCGESRTSGSGGGPEKQTDRKVGTALWAYLTW